MTYSKLKNLKSDQKEYSFYAAMRVRSPVKITRLALTDPKTFKDLPYIDEVKIDPSGRILSLQGGIWNYKLRSVIEFIFTQSTPTDPVHYTVIDGHFKGMKGQMLFEEADEGESRVYMDGLFVGDSQGFPPSIIMEKGAEIVFAVTATRMRSYLEKGKWIPQIPHDKEIPKPRKSF